jgi:hypothetical protein
MTLAANEIQKAIFVRLTAQLAGTPVYDHVPQDSAFPYVVIGADTSIPWDTKTNDGQEFTCTFHVWDKLAAGRKSVKSLMQNIYSALHQQESNLSLSGFTVVLMRCEFTETYQETAVEGEVDHYYHGVMRFRALVRNS